MNHNLKSKLGGILIYDYGDFNCIEFNTMMMEDGKFNLMIDIGYINSEDENYPYEYGYSIRTTSYTENLVDAAQSVTSFIALGMFDNLVFITEASCIDLDGNVKYDFDWNDYFASAATLN